MIRRFIESAVRADPNEIASFFTEDAVWWNSPWQPVTGREAIRETFRGAAAGTMTASPWEIRHIVAADSAADNAVLTQRIDVFLVGETQVRVSYMGIFELRAGKIAAWRDYWDSKQFELQLSREGAM